MLKQDFVMQINNGLTTEGLAINIDVTNLGSWNLNTDYTLFSTTKWNNTVVCDAILPDFGLTAYDNGRVSDMNSSLTLTQNDDNLSLYRVGYNASGNTLYNGYEMSGVTNTNVGNYISLSGGYFQGFYKLEGYDYEQFPQRFNNGITVETLIEISSVSSGIFYCMGTRAEDKYNQYFSGETTFISGNTILYGGELNSGNTLTYSGRTTSEGNYLTSDMKNEVILSSFSQPENSYVEIDDSSTQLENIGNNIIAFEITPDKKIGYKYINKDGLLMKQTSPKQIGRTGWTIISFTFKPYKIYNDLNNDNVLCKERRLGDLIVYVNGRKFWKIIDFEEFYFYGLNNHKEKQIGVPYNICWGGGSFGLKHSHHFDENGNMVGDIRKDNLLIEKYFSNSFIGNIQKLRVYDYALTSNKILDNAIFESKNTGYGIVVNLGGRIIYLDESIPYLPQQTSGSDIRKSIKYRNADGTFKDLNLMLDIKVLIKSRSNPSIDLVKFKKIAETDWLGLIYINQYTYDFIVPNSVTSAHPNEVLYAEIKFQWVDLNDVDQVFDKIFIVGITSNNLINNDIKNY